jgi:S-DNA-T family DNA segregation ATPase FtsK/SpoIIIE
MPHIGNIITIDSQNKAAKLFNYLEKEIQTRKNLFTDYSGSYINYCQNSDNKLPLIVTVLNGYESFMENCGELDDNLVHLLREGIKYGISTITTTVAANSMRTTTADYYQEKIMLQIADAYDYQFVMGAPRDLEPKKCFGRGLIKIEDEVLEFQTASVEHSDQINKTIKSMSDYLLDYYKYKVNEIKILPEKVFHIFPRLIPYQSLSSHQSSSARESFVSTHIS